MVKVGEGMPMTSLKAIRLKCLECSAGSAKEVRLCPIKDCNLYQYRLGHNPKRAGLGGKPPTQQAVSGLKTIGHTIQ